MAKSGEDLFAPFYCLNKGRNILGPEISAQCLAEGYHHSLANGDEHPNNCLIGTTCNAFSTTKVARPTPLTDREEGH